MHTDMRNRNLADPMRERCREIWWTIYILDSHMSALMGVPQSLAEHDVTAPLPEFAASTQKSLALGIHVKLARATSSILQSKSSCLAVLRPLYGCFPFSTNTSIQPSMEEKVATQTDSCTVSRPPLEISPISTTIELPTSGSISVTAAYRDSLRT